MNNREINRSIRIRPATVSLLTKQQYESLRRRISQRAFIRVETLIRSATGAKR